MTDQKNIIEQVTIEGFAAEARCIGKVDGKVVFVEYAAPGDIADLRITRKKKNFLEAVPVFFHQFSGIRQDPVCEHFGVCGGCRWQHIRYEHQLNFKFQQVKDQFERIGKLSGFELLPIIGSEETEFYRNKLEFTFSNQRWLSESEMESGESFDRNGLGFHKPGRFDKVLDIKKCHLQSQFSNDIRNALKLFARSENMPFYDLKDHTGFLRNLIIRTTHTGGCMIILQVKYEDLEAIKKMLDFLTGNFPAITSTYYIINPKLNESYQDLEAVYYSGEKYITEKMEDLSFIIGPKSFFQTNSHQAYRLYSLVREMAAIGSEEVVYDLYTGTGSIALFIAGHAKKVIGVEYIEEAIADARLNSRHNQITNTEFVAGDIKDVLKNELYAAHGKPDVVITDPPRAGMHPDVIKSIIDNRPDRIVYVSCNPATQARDIDLLRDHYRLVKAQPVDMFPHTHHIENIALLKIRKG
ncbi:MAG: 23S rRNA (uracil(1939)-C(5))-methyltransferase RlmD [Cyclobacteriaceae bacterium]|nr:23S rRNA (uracil(1939)-C(5))-methyltransferase RlmD [Cyclobacteriaceae bacterium]